MMRVFPCEAEKTLPMLRESSCDSLVSFIVAVDLVGSKGRGGGRGR